MRIKLKSLRTQHYDRFVEGDVGIITGFEHHPILFFFKSYQGNQAELEVLAAAELDIPRKISGPFSYQSQVYIPNMKPINPNQSYHEHIVYQNSQALDFLKNVSEGQYGLYAELVKKFDLPSFLFSQQLFSNSQTTSNLSEHEKEANVK